MTAPQRKRVAVIGAGASGLAAVKECLDAKDQIDVVCFEAEPKIGGLWRFVEPTAENKDPHSSVYRSTIINTSKELMTYSDLPIPYDWPTYLPNKKVVEYFEMYTDHFGLTDHIRFNTRVVEVKELKDENNRWLVRSRPNKPATTADGTTDETTTEEVFDYVMMCSGHHWKPRYPTFEGMEGPEAYTGEQMHSHFYREPSRFKGKNVLIVGLGNSAVDLAVELSMNDCQVYLSARRGNWVVPRWLMGKPLDHNVTRFTHMAPLSVMQAFLTMSLRLSTAPHHPNHRPAMKPLAMHPTINTLLPERITTGTVKPLKNIKKLGPGKRVEFEGGDVVDDVDVVIYCTGYDISFPTLDPNIVTGGRPGAEKTNEVWTWNYMVPPRHPNLAFVGLFQPLGAIMPISEMQCRFLVGTLTGKLPPLPSVDKMEAEIKKLQSQITKRYGKAPRHTIQVDYAPYCDKLAKSIGCYPGFGSLVAKYGLFKGLSLWHEAIWGPPCPVQYRLVGPGLWAGARESVWAYAKKGPVPPPAKKETQSEAALEV
ncbi:Cyclopentanone 1,2-monooxygenase (CPMO) [Actinomortierella ambigua]|uniref:Flavin-containing monooxygenase 1 n=1 Tax=Actinomortierella ambigua TaxID=1343610 RepID=A0A9P6QAL0_9FUNG|nr:Cyclopentanone 1,2-monooxygenase (CPMO) [Actinomortierella ambigua]